GAANSSLADVGVTMGDDGKLAFDSAKFQSKLASDPESVRRVFALTVKATHTGVDLVTAGAKTVVDGTAYAVNITQAASQARVTAGAAQTAALSSGETLTLNGVSVALTAGMSQAQVIQAINARTADTGVIASGTAADGTGTGSF